MWVPWVKKSAAHSHTRSPSFSFDNHLPSSPIHHHHSPSLKDIDTLFHHPPPLSPLHKHSLSALPFSPAQSPAHHAISASFKDIQSLLNDPAQAQAQAQPYTPSSPRKPSVFHRVRTWANRQTHQAQTPPPDSQNRVVVYYTSFRVVRRTCEDCRAVRSILKGYKVKMDERDLAVDARYVDELHRINPSNKKEVINLPRVYINGKYIGGVDEIRRLHDNGELKRMIQGLPLAEKGVCGGCGGFRYVVCEWCNGSRKICVNDKYGFKSCGMCNVNGLVQCGLCTSVLF